MAALVKGIIGEVLVDIFDGAVEQREDPAVFEGESIEIDAVAKISGASLRDS